jgi:3-keto-disaccharide hydrolase
LANQRAILLAVAALAALARLSGTGPSFHPDTAFKGSALTGWRPLGEAAWRAQNGEITGAPKQPRGGWLVLDHSYQDVGFYASFQCAAGCRTGVLLRAEKTAGGGMKGVFVSLSDGEVASYALTLDAEGRELKRDRLRPGGGQMRIAPPPDPNAPGRGGRGGAGRGGLPPGVTLPVKRPDTSLRPGDWNSVEIFLDANIVRAFLYDRRLDAVRGRLHRRRLGRRDQLQFLRQPGRVALCESERRIAPLGEAPGGSGV